MEGDIREGSRFRGVRCPWEPRLVSVVEVHHVYALEVGQLSGENSREKCENACCVMQVISDQFDVVHIVSEVSRSVKDCGESMEGGGIGKLDQVEKHPL